HRHTERHREDGPPGSSSRFAICVYYGGSHDVRSLLHELLQCKPSGLLIKRLPVEIRMNLSITSINL
ncbi:MAG: hypothetical protein AB7F76_17170, partial [Parvibaculaceae bacterium]